MIKKNLKVLIITSIIILLPMVAALQWLCLLVTSTDPNKQNHPEKVKVLVLWLIPIITVFISALMYVSALGVSVRVETLMPILLGLVFVVIGNYMPKCKQNYTIGIKIPWTLASEENWNRTHRLAGWVWVGGGVVMLLSGFLGIFWLTLVPAIIMVAVPLIYSYILHKKGI